jgi:hypothetical protein
MLSRTVVRLLVGFTVAGLLIIAAAGLADAETVKQPDKVGDSYDHNDIVRVRYTNGPRAFSMKMRVRGIRAEDGLLVFPKLLLDADWNQYFVIKVGARRSGERFHNLQFYGAESGGRVSCPDMTAKIRFSRDRVRVRVPQGCFGELRHHRFKVVGYVASPGAGEASDSTGFRWVHYN